MECQCQSSGGLWRLKQHSAFYVFYSLFYRKNLNSNLILVPWRIKDVKTACFLECIERPMELHYLYYQHKLYLSDLVPPSVIAHSLGRQKWTLIVFSLCYSEDKKSRKLQKIPFKKLLFHSLLCFSLYNVRSRTKFTAAFSILSETLKTLVVFALAPLKPQPFFYQLWI